MFVFFFFFVFCVCVVVSLWGGGGGGGLCVLCTSLITLYTTVIASVKEACTMSQVVHVGIRMTYFMTWWGYCILECKVKVSVFCV